VGGNKEKRLSDARPAKTGEGIDRSQEIKLTGEGLPKGKKSTPGEFILWRKKGLQTKTKSLGLVRCRPRAGRKEGGPKIPWTGVKKLNRENRDTQAQEGGKSVKPTGGEYSNVLDVSRFRVTAGKDHGVSLRDEGGRWRKTSKRPSPKNNKRKTQQGVLINPTGGQARIIGPTPQTSPEKTKLMT